MEMNLGQILIQIFDHPIVLPRHKYMSGDLFYKNIPTQIRQYLLKKSYLARFYMNTHL